MAYLNIKYEPSTHNITITRYSGLDKTIEDLDVEYEPVKKKNGTFSKFAATASAFTLMLSLATGCGPGGNEHPDGGADADGVTDGDTDGDGGSNLPPYPIDGSLVIPANGRVYNSGTVVPVVVPVPADQDSDDDMDVTGTLWTDDDGTPGYSAGDSQADVAFEPGVYAQGDIATGSVGTAGLPGTPAGQDYTLTLRVEDAQGGTTTLERTLKIRSGNMVEYCEIENNQTESNVAGRCYAKDTAGQFTNGEWEIECDITGGCGAIGTGEVGSMRIMDETDRGIHTLRVRARRDAGSSWTEWYEFPIMVDYAEARIGVETPAGTLELYGPVEYIAEIAQCFDNFDFDLIPQNSGDADHGGEVSTAADGQEATTAMYNCVAGEIAAHTTPDQRPLTLNLKNAHGLSPEERIANIDPVWVRLIAFLFGKSI